MRSARLLSAAVSLFVLATATLGAAPPPVKAGSAESTAFADFKQRVQQYAKLRKKAPSLRTTKEGTEIVDRRRGLAQAIREARPDAKQGDIFTPEISTVFVRVIQAALQGASVRKTIQQGDPVAPVSLHVNDAYPEKLPLTTVPPTLLARLPELPERLAYRIVGHYFVLQDTEARLIVDFIPAAIP